MRRIVTPMLVGALALAATVVTTGPTTAVSPTAWDGLVLGDGFEYGLGDWGTTHSGAAAVPNWRRAGLGQRSGIFAAHLDGAGSAADQLLTTAALPLGDAPQLSFWHRWDFEKDGPTNWDGGVVEYSVDDGTTWQDLSTLVLPATLGYNGTITDTSGNPLGGRQGYVGLHAAYTQVSLSLPDLASQTVRFRFRFGADGGVASAGWWIDDVAITNTAPGTVQLPDAPTGVQVTATSPTSVAVTFTPAGGSPSRPVVAHLATCSSNDGVTGTAYTRQGEVEVAGLTAGATYSCTVRAWTTAGLGAVSAPAGFSGANARPGQVAGASRPATTSTVSAPRAGQRDRLANFDALLASTARRQPSQAQAAALRAVTKQGTTTQLQDHLGVPTTLWAADRGSVVRPGASGERPEVAAARGHLARLAAVYRLSAQDVADARTAGVHDLGHGAVVVQFAQVVRGVPVWHERMNVVMTRNLGLVGLTGYLLPRHVSRGGFGLSSRAALAAAFADLTGHRPTGLVPAGQRAGYDRFTGSELLHPARAMQVLYRLPGGLVSAYYVELSAKAAGAPREFGYVVAAADGRVLNRTDLVVDENADFDYRVWADASAGNQPYDGPQGSAGSPHPTGLLDGYQAPFIPPSLIQGPLTGDPWLDLGATESTGNNVDAYTDITAPDGFTNGTADMRASTSSPGVFDYTYDHALSPTANETQAKAALTQLFYDINYLHDWFYDSGFDEAAGNAQQDNYGRGGAGGDPIHAEDQDNAATERDNANMSTPADGASPRMQMYLWTGISEAGLDLTPGGLLQVGLADFGPSSFDLTDDLVVALDGTGASTTDACEALTNGAAVNGTIAFVDRGNCVFQTKALNVQAAGAVAMVVANNQVGLPPSMPCSGNCATVAIPGVSISQADGDALETAIGAGPVTGRAFRINHPLRDGALDSTIVAHEWGHYLAHRLATSLGNQQAQAMGEGWSDFVALLMMVQPEDVAKLDGAFAVSAYAAAAVGSPNQYYFGLRRTPYSTDFTKDALTFKHITDGEPLPDVPLNILSAQNSEVHNAGEVWANMLWECYAALLADTKEPSPRLTFAEARKRMTDYLVASLKATPANPTYLEARDALLLTAWANDPADFELFLAAFARRGAGTGAVAPPRDSTSFAGVVESYSTDDGPPTTSITLSGGTEGNSGWYVDAPVASVTAVDGIAVSAVRCVLDDPTHQAFANLQDDPREPCDYLAPGAHLPEGVHTLHAASTDLTDQASEVTSLTVKVDSEPPTVVCVPAELYTGQPAAQVMATVSDLTSAPAADTASSAVDTSVPGAETVPVTGLDVAGNETTVDCPYTVTTDVTPPNASLTTLPAFITAPSIGLHYSATDSGSGIASYTIQVRKAAYTAAGLPASWSTLSTLPGAAFTAGSLVKGTTYCYRVLARDKAGNTSGPSVQRCTARLVDDPALKHSTGWSKVSSPAYYGGSASRTKKLGATLSLGNVHGVRLALRATTCPTCGSVKVLLGTTLVKTVSLVSATTKPAKLITIPLPQKMVGTVKITTRSTKVVTIDGLGLSHV